MNLRLITTSLFTIICCLTTYGQLLQDKEKFTKQDTLRGSITPERAWWDLTYYHLDIAVDPDEKFISGKNTIQYKVLETANTIQIDLQPPMQIKKEFTRRVRVADSALLSSSAQVVFTSNEGAS